jgi:hypothetical protein
MTPLRQFKGAPKEVIRRAETKQFVSETILIARIFDDPDSHGIAISTWYTCFLSPAVSILPIARILPNWAS